MGASASKEAQTNIAEAFNESVLELSNEIASKCPSAVRQIQDVEDNVINCGEFVLSQKAVVVLQCLQKSVTDNELMETIAQSMAQKLDADSGPAGLPALLSLSVKDQSNIVRMSNSIKTAIENTTIQKCDASIFQLQRLKSNVINVKGKCEITLDASINSECEQIANIGNRVAREFFQSADQEGALTNPFTNILTTLIIAGAAVAMLGIIAGIIYAVTRGRKEKQMRRAGYRRMPRGGAIPPRRPPGGFGRPFPPPGTRSVAVQQGVPPVPQSSSRQPQPQAQPQVGITQQQQPQPQRQRQLYGAEYSAKEPWSLSSTQ